MRHFTVAASLVLLLIVAPFASAQFARSGLVPDIAARQVGLTRAWYTHVEVDRGRGSVQYVTPYVSHANAHTVHDVVWETGKAEFSELDRDAFDKVVGVDGALEAANEKIDELKDQGFDPKLITRQVPEITLYVTTDRGVIQAINAETGETRWSQAVGRPDHPCLSPGVNEEFVAVINGSHVYVFNRGKGEFIWERELGGAPGAGPALSSEYLFAPLVNGHVELFRLHPEGVDKEAQQRALRFRAPSKHVAIGRNLYQPICTQFTCAWPTDRGFMYAANANKAELLYRSQANDTVTSPITFDPRRSQFLMTSIDGYVYALHERNGEVHWRFSAGSEISSSAYAVGDGVYVVTDDGGMFKIDAETGLEVWWTPRVRQFVCASVPPGRTTPPAADPAVGAAAEVPVAVAPLAAENPGRVYCIDQIGRLLVIDAKTGGRLGMLPTEELDLIVPNVLTDRMYIGTKSGVLQCLRELQLERPIIYAGPGSESKETIQVKVGDPGATTTPAGSTTDDPFGLSSPASGGAGGTTLPYTPDPFGTPSTPPAGGATPPTTTPFDPFAP